jgi:hypothetical protein
LFKYGLDHFVFSVLHQAVFDGEDIEILEAFCAEASTIIRSFLTDVILDHVDAADRDSVNSMIQLYELGTRVGSNDGDLDSSLKHTLGNAVRNSKSIFSRKASMDMNAFAAALADPQGSAAAVGGGGGVASAEAGELATVSTGVRVRDPTFGWPVPDPLKGVSMAQLQSLEFNVWSFSPDQLLVCAFDMFQDLGLLDEFRINPQKLRDLIMYVRANYRDNPFHNWYHGFAVMHFSYLMLRLTDEGQALARADVLAILVASLAHDVDHPGRTNAFEVVTDSDLAFAHNDQVCF